MRLSANDINFLISIFICQCMNLVSSKSIHMKQQGHSENYPGLHTLERARKITKHFDFMLISAHTSNVIKVVRLKLKILQKQLLSYGWKMTG